MNLNYLIYDVPGDGDCLFSSLADQVIQESKEIANLSLAADKLRTIAINCIMNMNNREEMTILEIFLRETYNETIMMYVERMSNKYTHGDDICLYALARELRHNIIVWDENRQVINAINVDSSFYYNILWCRGYNGYNHYNHYKSVRIVTGNNMDIHMIIEE